MESKGTVVGIIGLGLIGGSAALRLREAAFADTIIGTDKSADNLVKAIELGIIDKGLSLEELIKKSNVIIIAIPVDASKDRKSVV